MQGVVPAAGEGTRMRPLTEDRPKGLVEVAGKPLLTHVFEQLTALDVTELVVITGYRGDQIREFYGDEYEGVPISYTRQERREGLADALLQAEPYIDEDFLWLNGDNVIRANTGELLNRHEETDASVTTLVETVPQNEAGKGAVLERTGDQITGIIEKPENPPSGMVPRGFYVFSPEIFHAAHLVTPDSTGEYELSSAIDLLIQAGHTLESIELDGWCFNVNTPEQRQLVRENLAEE